MILLLDMDGVCVDFVRGVMERLGVIDISLQESWGIESWYGMTSKEFWSHFTDFEFWANLKKTPECDILMSFIKEKWPKNHTYFCSSPAKAPLSAAGKLSWIQKNYPEMTRRFILTPYKELLSKPQRILIDDYEVNLNKWIFMGGAGLCLKRPWNTKGISIQQVIEALEHVIKPRSGLVDARGNYYN